MSTISVRVDGPDQAAEARRTAVAVAGDLELNETLTSRIALVVTECANNLWKHAGGGEILLTASAPEPGIEILALDKGPGISNLAMSFRDGYSTAGSPGTGLGAIQRLSSECEVYSVPGRGTALLARIRQVRGGKIPRASERLEIGAISVAKRGEVACGDGYAVHQAAEFAAILVVDGLGHGPAAAECATAATQAFAEKSCQQPAEILSHIHGLLRATRGAAAAVARFDFARREVCFSGIGNIAGVLISRSESRHMTSLPGILGHECRNVREFTYEWPEGGLALLYSDGISTHWSIGAYEGLASRNASLIAGVLYRDWNRGRDDATVLAARDKLAP